MYPQAIFVRKEVQRASMRRLYCNVVLKTFIRAIGERWARPAMSLPFEDDAEDAADGFGGAP